MKLVKESLYEENIEVNNPEIIANIINKKIPDAHAEVADYCGYPYWNDRGPFILIKGNFDDAVYSGSNSGGPERVNNWKKTMLGKNLTKIANIANNHNIHLYKYYNKYFIML
jgi:hypothetical protein